MTKEPWNDTCKEVLGKSERQNKVWIFAKTLSEKLDIRTTKKELR
jgi:hypothetical protein